MKLNFHPHIISFKNLAPNQIERKIS